MTDIPPGELHYNRISGKSTEPIAALSDGLFAIAMTLLIIELCGPAVESAHSEGDLWRGIVAVSPRLFLYVISFMTLGIFWVGQQTMLAFVDRSDRHFTWINLALLAAIALFPFTTVLMAEFLHYRVAMGLYWLNILLSGAALYCGIAYSEQARLTRDDPAYRKSAGMLRGAIVVAQALYALGALMCFISTYLSIAFILLVQLYYAIAPTWRAPAQSPS